MKGDSYERKSRNEGAGYNSHRCGCSSGDIGTCEAVGADAIRDCDGTDYPAQLRDVDAKVYSTYYTTRKYNAWAKANPDEIQQMYIMTPFYNAPGSELSIHLMIICIRIC